MTIRIHFLVLLRLLTYVFQVVLYNLIIFKEYLIFTFEELFRSLLKKYVLVQLYFIFYRSLSQSSNKKDSAIVIFFNKIIL